MARGGRRPGAGRPKGSPNTKLVWVEAMLPALATEADKLEAARTAPEIAEALAPHRGSGALVSHRFAVVVGLTRRGTRLSVRPD